MGNSVVLIALAGLAIPVGIVGLVLYVLLRRKGGQASTGSSSPWFSILPKDVQYVLIAVIIAVIGRFWFHWSGDEGDGKTVILALGAYAALKYESKLITVFAYIVGAALILMVLGINPTDIKEVLPTKSSAATAGEKLAVRKSTATASWAGTTTANSSGLPVNEWSEYAQLDVGCSIKFTFDPSIHRVKYRFYSAEEHEYKVGTSPNMSELAFMVLKEGITKVPYTITCPN